MNIDRSQHSLPASLGGAVVLVVDDEPTVVEMLTLTLSQHYRVFSASSGEEAIGFCAEHAPDLVVLDLHMPELDGLLTCKMLKAIPNMTNCPIVFLTGDTSLEKELECWDAGATDFVPKPIVTQSLIKRLKSHVCTKLHSDIRDNMVFIDEVTGLYNRRYFNDFYEKQISLAQRNEGPLSLVIIELKTTPLLDSDNTSENAERCFKQVANVITQHLSRPTDTVIRFSSNRFAILLPDTYIFGAKHIAQKVLLAVGKQKDSGQHSLLQQIEIAAGLASLESLPKSMSLLEQAEKNLLHNRESGNSQVA